MSSIAQSWAAEREAKKQKAQQATKEVDSGRPTVYSSNDRRDAIAFVNDRGTVQTWQRDLDRTDALALAHFLIHVYAGHETPVVPPPKVTP